FLAIIGDYAWTCRHPLPFRKLSFAEFWGVSDELDVKPPRRVDRCCLPAACDPSQCREPVRRSGREGRGAAAEHIGTPPWRPSRRHGPGYRDQYAVRPPYQPALSDVQHLQVPGGGRHPEAGG